MLFLRVWLGWQWIAAGLHKLTNPAWMVTGEALKGFWVKAIVLVDGKGPIAYAWYRAFIQFMLNAHWYIWFAKLIALGEFLLGAALILGIFVGVAALIGAFMNWNFMMAGSASVNPMLFVVSLLLMVGWRFAGYFGADYWLLNWVRSLKQRWSSG